MERGETLSTAGPAPASLSRTAVHTKLAADSDASVVAKNLPVKKGMVVQVNQTHHFIITSLNRAQGVELGQTVQIYQEGAPLGVGRVERVYETLTAVTILSEDTLERVKTGDQVYLAIA
jgi:hypothetical protein